MKHLEDSMQVAFFKWADMQYPNLNKLLHHSPNGGKRNATEAVRFKRMGVRAGFPDVILLLPKNGYGSLCMGSRQRRANRP
ncbi:VRR-NUC domain protein [Bacteroidales bacterium Barb7]|nr:VRR-NUC domain protein [Bacteroidales bacterium Barb7]